MKKILFIVNVDWFFISHRLSIAEIAMQNGYEVHIATTITTKLDLLINAGLIVHPINIHRSNGGLISVFRELIQLVILIRSVSPDIVHLVTIKPVLLGGIAARINSTSSVVSSVSGLGFVFTQEGYYAKFVKKIAAILYRLSFNHKNLMVIFQNKDDKLKLMRLTRLTEKRTTIIDGSGVNLSLFSRKPLPDGLPVVMMASRLLADKGVREFVLAAKQVRLAFSSVRFVLVGEVDVLNPSSVKQEEVDLWKKEGVVEVWGGSDNMAATLSKATIVILPSYREGFPKVLIEAAACGRAVITTNVPGCRDAIKSEITGLLVPVKSARALSNATLDLLKNPDKCKQMGDAGRKLSEEKFDIKQVTKRHMRIYRDLIRDV